MRSFLGILAFARPYKNLAAYNLFFNILYSVFSLFSLLMIIPFLEILFGTVETVNLKPEFELSIEYAVNLFNYSISSIITEHGQVKGLALICVVVLVIFFLKNLFRYLAMYCLAPLRNGVVRDLRKSLFQKLLTLPVAYFTEKRKGDIVARMTNDVTEIEWSIMNTLEVAFREPLNIILNLAAMFIISPQLSMFVIILLPFSGLIIGRIGKSLKRKSIKAQATLGSILSLIEETISGLRIIKGFNARDYQQDRFDKENEGHYKLLTSMLHRRDLSSPLSEFLGIAVVVVVLWFGGRMVIKPDYPLQPEVFIAFIAIFSQLISPAKAFANAFYFIQRGLASVERIEEVLHATITIKEPAKPKTISKLTSGIVFDNVSFFYENNVNVLKQINMTIKRGKMVALVGQSGAGKSTIADLLARFYDPTDGVIYIDGIDIREYSLSSLRGLMGIVTQEPILFHDTVKNNIAFGLDNYNDEEIIKAAKAANAHDFIKKMAKGYDTIIGDRGIKLSGGEKQRLTIARAILKNPPILILDEATSSLDTASEKLVQDALFKLMQNRTSIVIAHRLSTIQFADEILVMKEGEILERGNHNALMAKNGTYSQLVDLQAF